MHLKKGDKGGVFVFDAVFEFPLVARPGVWRRVAGDVVFPFRDSFKPFPIGARSSSKGIIFWHSVFESPQH